MKFCVLFSVFLLYRSISVQSASVPWKQVSNDEESISCHYFGGGEFNYECQMTINNPNGIEFESIDGIHLPDLGNDDVQAVNAFLGSSRIVPSVICRQFPNLNHLTVMGINVEELTPAAFADCRNLVDLFLVFNEITTVPANTFANSPNLEYIELSRNSITELNENSFTGTGLTFIALDYNQLSRFDQIWFTSINGTLQHLELMQNPISELGANAFGNLRNLRELILNYNTLGSGITPDAFDGLTNLQILSLSRTGITALLPEWFSTLTSLNTLFAQNNEISELANGTFNSLTNIRSIFLNGNQIREVRRSAFGQASQHLHTIYLSDNHINNIDPYWINDAENLEYLLLTGNLCIDRDFLNVNLFRWLIFEELQQCIVNFMAPPWVNCFYVNDPFGYSCSFSTHNPNGLNDFAEIPGDHLEDRSDSDITVLTSIYSNTRIIPSIVCTTFSNLQTIFIMISNLEELTGEHLSNCVNLVQLSLHSNRISSIADFTFQNNINLQRLELGDNRIMRLPVNAFTGTRINHINMFMNSLSEFDPRVFESINETLVDLDLFSNSIVMLQANVFANLRNLERLFLGNNPLWSIPGDAFNHLVNLRVLDLDRCGLNYLNLNWFQDLSSLVTLDLQHNNIQSLPDGVFDGTNLARLSIHDNSLRLLSAAAFGSSLQTLIQLFAERNRIIAVDTRLVEEATRLDWLFLAGNLCTSRDFRDASSNLNEVLRELERCRINFEPERVSCRYYQPGELYTCSLDIHNPLGSNEFTDVEGEHDEGRTDEDVRAMYIFEGRTLNIPSILCEKFVNLEQMDFIHDEIEYVDENSFSACANIRRIYIHDNLISSLPEGTFRNNPLLEELSLGHNRLTPPGLPANIFAGTSLNFLDLSLNLIVDFNPAWIIPVASTLRTLEIFQIGATHLPVLFFNNPSILEVLDIAGNPLSDIIPTVFERLPTLRFLDMANCQFRNINSDWFRELRNLETLRISGNRIVDLPTGVFAALENMTTLYVDSNRLRELNVDVFGPSISSLRWLYATHNQITGISPNFLQAATNLEIMYLSENVCVRENFYEINQNIEEVQESISTCIENFSAERIRCIYVRDIAGTYNCLMSTFNPLGRNNFEKVEGEHVDGYNDEVEVVQIRDQNTRIVPSIICEQFPNLRMIMVINSSLDLITERNFDNCPNLQMLMIYGNDVDEIPNFAFQNNERLEYLELGFNRIREIGEFAFSGTSVSFLDLASNNLGGFNPFWFEPINSTLTGLDLMNTGITLFPLNSFRNIRNLRTLVLSRNNLLQLPPNLFDGLNDLEDLFMSNCEIFGFAADTFRALGSIRALFLENNFLSFIPNRAFDSFRNITIINLSGNLIWELRSDDFGRALWSLQTINLSNNIINLFNEPFIREARSLRGLYLAGNACARENINNVNQDFDLAVNMTRQCIDNFNAAPSIRCDYMETPYDQYLCDLSVIDPRGFNPFANIPGDHVPGRTNNDVIAVVGAYQNSRMIPTAICSQFLNLEDISIFRSNIAQISRFSLSSCRNLKALMIDGGFITQIPDNTFIDNPNLEYLSLADNRIFALFPTSFDGSRIETLDLAFNRISLVFPEVMDPISETLTNLNMVGNQIRGFPIDTFENLGNIQELYLDRNPLTELRDETFLTLPNLRVLSLAHCQLTRLNGMMFYEMVNVHTLRLHNNQISMLPEGAFHNMTSLEVLYIGENNLGFMNASQFGGAMSSVRIINAPSNRINALDRDLIEGSTNLNNLLLAGNICVDDTFNNVQDNFDEVTAALQICFTNFDTAPEIECTFSVTEYDDYLCDVRVHNPIDEEFQSIAGQHVTGMSDDDVRIATVVSQNTKTFPGVICQQFSDLRQVLVMNSNLEILEPAQFASCLMLEQIYLNQNRITFIPPQLFMNSRNLELISLSSNRITGIHPTSFSGTAAAFVDLSNNRLTNISPNWLTPISRTLNLLEFYNNLITRIPDGTFNGLTNLEFLLLGSNRLDMDSNPFGGLQNLKLLGLGNTGIRELNPSWFTPLQQLEELFLYQNGIADLPAGIFSSFTNLTLLNINDNLLTAVRADAFGSLASLTNLQLIHNLISSFDPQILDNATNLNHLLMQGNICVNENFNDVANQVEEVRNSLQQCFV